MLAVAISIHAPTEYISPPRNLNIQQPKPHPLCPLAILPNANFPSNACYSFDRQLAKGTLAMSPQTEASQQNILKRVLSEAQRLANRLNAQKSTGPKTEAGKAKS